MLLIKNGTLYTMEREDPIHGDLLIEDGKITRIAEDIEPTDKMEVIDATNLWSRP